MRPTGLALMAALGVTSCAVAALAGPPALVPLDCPAGTSREVRPLEQPPAEGHVGLPRAAKEVVCIDGNGLAAGPALHLRSASRFSSRRLLQKQRFPRRDLIRFGRYLAGRRHGAWTQVDRTGRPLGVNHLDRGNGTWRVWHFNGQEGAAGAVHDDERRGQWHFRHRNGNRAASGSYRAGKRHGPWRLERSNGELDSVVAWRDGNKHGLETRWHPGGDKSSEGHWVDGQKDGDWWFWNGRGALLGRNRLDRGTGQWTDWHEGGGKRREGRLLMGGPDGPWTRWHPNGQRAAAGEYSKGVMTRGTWTYWDPRGKVANKSKRAKLLGRLGALPGLGVRGGGNRFAGSLRAAGALRIGGIGRGVSRSVSRSTIRSGRKSMVTSRANWRDAAGKLRFLVVLYAPPTSVDLTGSGLTKVRDELVRCSKNWLQQKAPASGAAGTRAPIGRAARFRLDLDRGRGPRVRVLKRGKAMDKAWHVCATSSLSLLQPKVNGPSARAKLDATLVLQ